MSRSRSPANQIFLTFTSPALCKNKASWFLLALVLLLSDTLPFNSCNQTNAQNAEDSLFCGIFDPQNKFFRSCPFWLTLFCIFFWRSKPLSGRNPSVCIPAQPWRFLFLIGFPRRPKAFFAILRPNFCTECHGVPPILTHRCLLTFSLLRSSVTSFQNKIFLCISGASVSQWLSIFNFFTCSI